MIRPLEKVAKKVIEWKKQNVVTYNTLRIKAVVFSKSYQQWLSKQLWEAKTKVDTENISFKEKATWWFEVWLDS